MESTSSCHSSNVNCTMSAINKDEKNPLWRYVTKIEKLGEGGGNCRWVCNFCNQEKQGTYTRVRAHLLQITGSGVSICKEVGIDKISEMRKMEGILDQTALSSQPQKEYLPSTTRSPLSQPSGSSIFKKRRVSDTHTNGISDLQIRDQLDAEIARMFYAGGLPFNLARNPYFISAFTFAASHSLGGYVPPDYNKLTTTLLQKEKTRLERLLEPIKSTWFEKGVSIITNGWSDPQRRQPINIMAVSDSGPMFMKAVDCSGEIKDAHFIANLLKQVINKIGDQNVVQIITDNARNCKVAGDIIEGMFPDIYWTPCIVQALDLALKNICSAENVETNQVAYDLCNWINIVHGDALQIKNFVMNHSMRLAIYNRFSSLKLLSVADTRFASIIVTLKRFKLIRRALEAMVLSEQWAHYREDDQEKARFVRHLVLDEDWWEKVNYILAFTAPIYEMLRACDTDKPCLHLVHERWDAMIEMVHKVIYEHERKQLDEYSAFYDVVHIILDDQWAKSISPLHCLAHSLNPRYYSEKWLQGGEDRKPPHKNWEVARERIKCFKRFFPNDEDRVKSINEFGDFSLQMGQFGDPDSIESRFDSEPRQWWACYGSSAPLLQRLAFRVLGQPSSSSCCQRNWSTYSFIHSLKRNKSTSIRADNLVFIHNNLRLLSRGTSQYHDEKTKMWDVGGDEFGNMEDTSVLEFANLSLDEPELEYVVFTKEAM